MCKLVSEFTALCCEKCYFDIRTDLTMIYICILLHAFSNNIDIITRTVKYIPALDTLGNFSRSYILSRCAIIIQCYTPSHLNYFL